MMRIEPEAPPFNWSAFDVRERVPSICAGSAVRRMLEQTSPVGVITIHDINLAIRKCDQLAVLDRGEIIASGPPANVITPEVRPEIRNLADLRPTSLDDLRKRVVDVVHLETKVPEARFVDPRLITMVGGRMLIYFEKRAFKCGKF
ncbi:hypothetical protein [Rhizobium fabae]|uniref:ABC-type multidrug transport system ATPase subunit n=2 Tax=Rhizobium fabae TaxID=573179 RepID=A0A7W6FNK2_9HYPH|nr:hypothetical protein [Rhizobium fabae]MBB3919611.1 ABC-type multidrug transport system ATPase subunit [Rhizobium fabae]